MSESPRAPTTGETRVDLAHIDALEETVRATDEFQVRAKHLMGRWFILLKLARLYDLSNAAFPGPLAQALDAIEGVAGGPGGSVSLQLLPEGMFVNRVLLDLDEAVIERTHYLYATFHPRGVGEIHLLPGVTRSDLSDLLAALQQAPQRRG